MAALAAALVLGSFLIAYRFYARFLGERIFQDEEDVVTPAHELQDGLDFVPTQRAVLFGHHFTSIAGAAPIIGPCVAAYWGWGPALTWVVLGTIFMGAAHDFGALVASVREKGRSIADITAKTISGRARILFMCFVLVLIWLVLAVFAMAIAGLFVSQPTSVIPINIQIIVAIVIGWLVYKRSAKILWPSLIALAVLYFFVWVGTKVPVDFVAMGVDRHTATTGWIFFLLIYSAIASLLPVWLLLQPRDYINSHQLFVGLGLLFLGVLIAHPSFDAPVYRTPEAGAPSIFPILFVTIACGAISGFHGLVGSGTSSKQLAEDTDARYVGYGGALGEGTLAVTSIIATTAGFALFVGLDGWHEHYGSWASASAGATTAFVNGVGMLAEGLGIPHAVATIFAAVIVISFAATSLDTSVRLQRYIISELGVQYRMKVLQNRWLATLVAVGSSALLALGLDRGAGGMRIWPLFGTTNQLLAGLTLLIVSLFLIRLRRPAWVTVVPMSFVLVMTTWAMILNLIRYRSESQTLLLVVGGAIFVLELWLLFEAVAAVRRLLAERREGALALEPKEARQD